MIIKVIPYFGITFSYNNAIFIEFIINFDIIYVEMRLQ